MRKSDGGFGYAATDLAALRYRVRELGANRLLYVVGTPQAMHFQMVYAVARAAGWLTSDVGLRTRRVRLDPGRRRQDVPQPVRRLDPAGRAARRGGGPGRPALTGDPAVAEAVGIGAIKYADLSSDRLSDYVFDWDRMLALTGNTGPYLQYAHARIRSIFDRAGDVAPGRLHRR